MRTTIILPAFLIISLALVSCSKEENTVVRYPSSVTSSTWRISSYFYNEDLTENYSSYTFAFNFDGTVTASTSWGSIVGVWGSGNSFLLDFGNTPPLRSLNNNWVILKDANNVIELAQETAAGSQNLRFTKVGNE